MAKTADEIIAERRKKREKTYVVDPTVTVARKDNVVTFAEEADDIIRRRRGESPLLTRPSKPDLSKNLFDDTFEKSHAVVEQENKARTERNASVKSEAVQDFLKNNPGWYVNKDLTSVVSADDKSAKGLSIIEDEYNHKKNYKNEWEFGTGDQRIESKIYPTGQKQPAPSHIDMSREYNPYDKGFLNTGLFSDRTKLKWDIGKLRDDEGKLWSKASQTGKKEDYDAAMKVSTQIDSIYEEYPEMLTDMDYNKANTLSRIGGFLRSGVEGTAEMLPTMIGAGLEGAKYGLPAGAAAGGIAFGLGQAGPQIALPEEIISVPSAIAKGYSAASAFGSGTYMYNVEKGHSFKAMIDSGVPADVANRWSTVVGALNAGLELAQLDELLKGAKVAGNLSDDLASEGLKKFLSSKGIETAKQYGVSVGKETGQEVAQEVVGIVGETAAKKESGQDAKLFTEDNFNRLSETAISSLKSFAVLHGAGQFGGAAFNTASKQSKKAIQSVVNRVRSNPELMNDEKVRKEVQTLLEEVKNTNETVNDPVLAEAEQKLVQIQTDYSKSAQISSVLNESTNEDKQVKDTKENSQEIKPVNVDTSNEQSISLQDEIDNERNFVNTSRFGEVEVIDNDGALVTIKNKSGTELKIGLVAFEKMVQEADQTNVAKVETPVEISTVQETKEAEKIARENFADAMLKTPGYEKYGRETAYEQADILIKVIREKDFETLTGRLHRGNNNSLKLFKEITGKPVDTNKITIESIRSLDPKAYDSWKESKAKEKADRIETEKRESFNAIGETQLQPISLDGKVHRMKLKDFYDLLMNDGYKLKYINKDFGRFELVKQNGDKTYSVIDPIKMFNGEQRKWIRETYALEEAKRAESDALAEEQEYNNLSDEEKDDLNHLFGFEGFKADDSNEAESGKNKEETQKPVNETPTKAKYQQQTNEIAGKVQEMLSIGTKITSKDLFAISDTVFKGTQAEGKYTVKDAFDALELGVNQHILKMKDNLTVKKMQEILELLPTQTKRTKEMEDFQQFSTPPSIAFVASWVANIDSNDVFLEPSAGIGGLAVFAKKNGAKVFVNEYSKRRLDVLRNMPFDGFFNENAEQLNNILPTDIKPSVIVMNPPFSATAGRMGDKNSTKYAKAHIEQALKRLEPNGRLVAIVGNGMSYDSPTFKSWWKELEKQYNIKANIGVDGRNYTKYGTSFDIQMVVIDKTGPTINEVLIGKVENISDLPLKLEAIRDERLRNDSRPEQTQRSDTDSNSAQETGSGSRSGGTDDHSGVSGSGKTRSDTAKKPSGNNGSNIGNPNKTTTESTSNTTQSDSADGNTDKGKTGDKSRTDNNDSSRSDDRQLDGKRDSQPDVDGIEVTSEKAAKEGDISEDDIYAQYTPQKLKIKGAKEHLSKLVQSAAMSAVEPPNPHYSPKLPKRIIEDGELTLPQLESVVYAGQAHEQLLPNGTRKGFFIGDGTGVGKGRQVAGIILDNFNQGRQKAVWMSERYNLYSDAIRDWTGLDGNKDDVVSHNKFKVSDAIKMDKGILFTTYSTLASGSNLTGKVKKKEKSETRLQQIVDWLGADFDGVIIFDEAHNMGNAIAVKGARGMKKTSEKALAGIELQKMLPKARVVYASATGATEVTNLAFATRLGLWGEGTAFNDVTDFITKIAKGGVGAMEVIARDMKAMGSYIARNISFDGVEYDTLEHSLTPMQNEIYDTLSSAWQVVLQNMEKALVDTGQAKSGARASSARSQFWSANQSFYNQVITSMSMPSVIASIKEDLKKGNAVVLQIVNTNEAATERQLAKLGDDSDLEDLDLTPSDTLIRFLENSFPIQQFEEYETDDGKTASRPVYDSEGNPVINREALAQKERLISDVKQMSVPQGPLEILLETFGAENVAEVTGRSRRVYFDSKKGKTVVEKRSKLAAEADANAFQDDKKQILVFSDAGGTGKSYHADKRAKNQRRRIHYLLQPGWNASKATQGFGRTHRTNQASAPIFRLVTTNLSGQKRFISTIAKRLDQLGALTKGQRQAGNGIFSEKDNLEGPIARDTLRQFYQLLYTGRAGVDSSVLVKMGLYDKLTDSKGDFYDDEVTTTNIGQFLNRILNLNAEDQNNIFAAFSEQLEKNFQKALALGMVDVGLENYKAEKIEFIDEHIINTTKEGAQTKYVQLKAFKKYSVMTFEEAKSKEGFREFRRIKETDELVAVYKASNKTLTDGSVKAQYKLVTPMKTANVKIWVEDSFLDKTETIEKSKWASEWKAEIAKLPELKEETLHLLTGALLPIWNKLPEKQTRVLRIIDTNNETYLGRLIEAVDIDSVLRNFNTSRTKETTTTDTIIDKVLKENKTANFQGKLKLVRKRVSGENRIEIQGPNLWYVGRIQGVITEKINYDYRYFVPTDLEKGGKVIAELMKNNDFIDFSDGFDADESNIGPKGVRNFEAWSSEKGINKFKSGKNVKIKPVHEIMKDITKQFGVGITSTRFRSKKAYAHFKAFPQMIETKIANTIEPLMHELGHFFDQRYNLSSHKALLKDMIDKMPEDFKEKYKPSELKGEAIAEFVRLYMTSPADAAEYSNDFYDVFEKALKPNGDLEKLQAIREDILKWLAASTKEQIKSTIISRTDNVKLSDIKNDFGSKLKLLKKKSYMFLMNELQPLSDFVSFVEETTGLKIPSSKDAAKLAELSLSSPMIARQITLDGLQNVEGEVIGDSFKSIFKDLKVKEYKDFSAYLISKRAIDYWKRGKRTFSDDLPISYIEAVVEEFESENPHFVDMANKMYAWWEAFTNEWIVKTGLLDYDVYEYMRKLEPHYVPFFRLRNEQMVVGDAVMQLSRRGYVDHRNPIKRSSMKGSADPIFDPVESMLIEIERYVTTVRRREVFLSIHDIYTKLEKSTSDSDQKNLADGLGQILNRVNPRMSMDKVSMVDKKLKLSLSLYDEYAKTMTVGEKLEYQALKFEVDNGKATFEDVLSFFHEKGYNAMEVVDEIIDDIELEFRPMEFDKEKNIVTVKDRNGKTVHYEIYDAYLLEALLNTDPTHLDKITRVIIVLRRVFQSLITTFEPTFLARNISKDSSQGFVGSKIPMHQYHAAIIKALYQEVTKGEWSKSYKRSGGGYASPAGANRDALKETMASVIPGWKRKHPIQTILQTAEKVSDAIEQAPRLAEYRFHVEKNGDTFEGRLEGLLLAKDVTVNFTRKGQIMRTSWANAIPFLNPALQGVDKFRRLNTDDIAKTLPRAFIGILLPTLVLYAINHDDEDYKRLSKYAKDNYYHFKTDEKGVFTRIPKPRDLGMVYSSMFERALDAFVEKDPTAWDEFFVNLASSFAPPVEPITEAWSDAQNNKTWYDGDIVPYAYQDLEKDQQFDDRTSWFSKQLAKIIPDSSNLSSPMVLDYLIQQYTGLIGKLVIPMTDNIKGNGFSSFNNTFTTDVAYSNNVVPKFYDRLREMESAIATAKAGRPVKGYKGLNAKPVFDKINNEMKDIRKLHDTIDKISDTEFEKVKSEVSKTLGVDMKNLNKEQFKRALKLEIVRRAEYANKVYDEESKKLEDYMNK